MDESGVGEGLVRVADACRLLALSCSKLYTLMENGQLSYVKFGRSRRIPRQALAVLIRKNMVNPAAASQE